MHHPEKVMENTMRIFVSYIFICLALVGCSDPEQTQNGASGSEQTPNEASDSEQTQNGSSSSGEQTQGTPSPEVVYSVPKTEQGFEPPKQVVSSPLFKLVSIASSEKPTAELSSVNYQVRVK